MLRLHQHQQVKHYLPVQCFGFEKEEYSGIERSIPSYRVDKRKRDKLAQLAKLLDVQLLIKLAQANVALDKARTLVYDRVSTVLTTRNSWNLDPPFAISFSWRLQTIIFFDSFCISFSGIFPY